MATGTIKTEETSVNPHARARRAPWRQRLIDAERGYAQGFRGDSIFFVHLFAVCLIAAFGAVLGIGPGRWMLVILAVSIMLTAEFLNAAMKAALDAIYPDGNLPPSARQATHLGTAAVTTAVLGGLLTIGMIYAQPFLPILRD